MKLARILPILAFALTSAAGVTAVYYQWSIGTEREVDEGTYARLYYQQNGWRVWRFENRTRVWCKAVKSAVGLPHPVPVGVSDYMVGGTPNLVVEYHDQIRRTFKIEGAEAGEQGEYREVGEKFWSPIDSGIEDLDGKMVQIHVTSWEYPAIMVGFSDQKGVLNLLGMSGALRSAEECVVSD